MFTKYLNPKNEDAYNTHPETIKKLSQDDGALTHAFRELDRAYWTKEEP